MEETTVKMKKVTLPRDYNKSDVAELVNLTATRYANMIATDGACEPTLIVIRDMINEKYHETSQRVYFSNMALIDVIYEVVFLTYNMYGADDFIVWLDVDDICRALELLGFIIHWYD